MKSQAHAASRTVPASVSDSGGRLTSLHELAPVDDDDGDGYVAKWLTEDRQQERIYVRESVPISGEKLRRHRARKAASG